MKKQVRVVLENCGIVDPLSLGDYLAREGMRALEKCLKDMSPDQVIETCARPACAAGAAPGSHCRQVGIHAARARRRQVCDRQRRRGRSGAFMDRAVLEADPFGSSRG